MRCREHGRHILLMSPPLDDSHLMPLAQLSFRYMRRILSINHPHQHTFRSDAVCLQEHGRFNKFADPFIPEHP
jgi:hypothetical protein